VRCYTERGSKRVRYGMAGHGGGFLLEQMRFIGAMADLLKSTAARRPNGEASARLTDMGAFYARLHDALEEALAVPGQSEGTRS
jgi:hypothetical protein